MFDSTVLRSSQTSCRLEINSVCILAYDYKQNQMTNLAFGYIRERIFRSEKNKIFKEEEIAAYSH